MKEETLSPIDGDVTEDEALVGLVDKTIKKFRAIHTLLNNVGGGGTGKNNSYNSDIEKFKKSMK